MRIESGPPSSMEEPSVLIGRRIGALIARQVWWSPDGQFVYAAVAELGADVVMYDGLLSP